MCNIWIFELLHNNNINLKKSNPQVFYLIRHGTDIVFLYCFVYPHSESFHLLCEIFLLLYTRIHLLCEKIRLFLFFFRLIFADFTIDFEKNKLFKIREDSSITALSCFIFINICFFNLLYIIIYIKTQGTSYGY